MRGEIDLAVREQLNEMLVCIRERGCRAVEIDAQEVTFVDASCLRVLHDERTRLSSVAGTLVVIAASARFVEIVGFAGYNDLLPGPSTTLTGG